mgnify:CR=1 FL=1
MQSGKIIQIADLINDKLRKEQELEFYEEELQKLLILRVLSSLLQPVLKWLRVDVQQHLKLLVLLI